MQAQPHKMTRVTGATEVAVLTQPGRLIAIFPEVITAGTVTVRDAGAIGGGSTPRHTCAAGLPLLGMQLGGGDSGVLFTSGITIQLSNGADAVNVVWDTLF